jgi:hypothetical protein
MYRRVLRATDPATRARFNLRWLNISNEMDARYAKYLELKLLCAAGLRLEVARKIHSAYPNLAARFCSVFVIMSALKNPGSACVARKVVRDLCVVDVFAVLGNVATDLFANRDVKRSVLKHARPVYKGNRFHVRAKQRRVDQLAEEFAIIYRELMNVAANFYRNRTEMERSIASRAAFENQPLDALYCHPLYEDLNRAIAEYKATGNAQIISEAIDTRIAQSLRSVDGLLSRGSAAQKQLGHMIDRGDYIFASRRY